MMLRRLLFLTLGLLLLALGGYKAVEHMAHNTPHMRLLAEIDAADSQWRAQNIQHYTLSVRSMTVWHGQTDTITVRNEEVIDHSASCGNSLIEWRESCEVQSIDPQEYTVEGLFALAREFVNHSTNDTQGIYQLEGLTFQFHPVYGYPERIAFSPTDLMDADMIISAENFEINE